MAQKLLQKSSGAFKVLMFFENLVTIDQDGLQHMETSDRASRAPCPPLSEPLASRTLPSFQIAPSIPLEPLITDHSFPQRHQLSPDPDGPYPDGHGPLEEILLPEEVPDTINIAPRSTDALSLDDDGNVPLEQKNLREDTELGE